MKKLLLAAAIAVLSGVQLKAQCAYTCSNYAVSEITYSLFPTTGINAIPSFSPSADDGTLTVSMGFNFDYYCNTYSQVNICSNGFIQLNYGTAIDFGSPPSSQPSQNFPSTAVPNGLIALNMNDFDASAGGAITYTTIGAAPNRIFIVTYDNVPIWYDAISNVPSSPVYNTGQIVLYETSNIIEIYSGSIGQSPYTGTQGIENTTGTLGATAPGRNSSMWSSGNKGYRFSPYTASPPSAVTGPTNICAGTQVVYNVSPITGATSYNWSTPGNGWAGSPNVTAFTATAGVSGNIQVTASYTCGTSLPTTLAVTTIAAPTVAVSADPLILCSGNTVTFSPTGAASYTLEPGGYTISSGSFVITPGASAGYTLTGTNASNCLSVNSATSFITVHETPTVTVSSGAICAGQSFSINAAGADTYVYSNGFAVVNPTAGIYSYSVVGTATNGCPGAEAVSSLTVNTLPVVGLSANKTNICKSEPAVITASGADTYLLLNDQSTTAVNTVTPSATTVYTVTGTSTEGCSKSMNITINVDLCVGIAGSGTIEKNNVVVYPNPSSGEFNLDVKQDVHIMIYDLQGKVVYRETLPQGSHIINMNAASAGQYLLKATSGEKAQNVILIRE